MAEPQTFDSLCQLLKIMFDKPTLSTALAFSLSWIPIGYTFEKINERTRLKQAYEPLYQSGQILEKPTFFNVRNLEIKYGSPLRE